MSDPSELRRWIRRVGARHGFGSSSSAAGPALGAPAAATPRSGSSTRRGRGRPPVSEVTFGEDEVERVEVPVSRGDPGIASEQQIVNALQSFKDSIQDYWSNYSLGLQNFVERMHSSSDQESEPQHLKAVFKAVAKQALEIALREAGNKLGPYWGDVIDTVKVAIEAWSEESERAATAAGLVRIADYVESIRNGIPRRREAMLAALESKRRPLLERYQSVARTDAGGGRASAQGVVVGDSARILNDVNAGVAAFRRAIPSPSYFQTQFATRFADTPGLTDNISHGGRPSGTLYFNLELYVNPGATNAWRIKEKDSAWRLVTSAPNPESIATSLSRSLEGKQPWQIELPKMVKMCVEIEEQKSHAEGTLYFTSNPDSFQVRTHHEERWFREAWAQPQIRAAVLNCRGIAGGSE